MIILTFHFSEFILHSRFAASRRAAVSRARSSARGARRGDRRVARGKTFFAIRKIETSLFFLCSITYIVFHRPKQLIFQFRGRFAALVAKAVAGAVSEVVVAAVADCVSRLSFSSRS